jgi:hypothetical protein
MTYANIFLGLLLLFATANKEATPPVATLDLRRVVPQLREREPVFGTANALGIGPGSNLGRKIVSSAYLSVAIMKADYTGHSLLIALSIRNTSTHDVTLPWNPHPRSIERNARSYDFQTMSILFGTATEEALNPQRSWVVLYGSVVVAKTTLQLRPGESAVILSEIPVTSRPQFMKGRLILSDNHFYVRDGRPSEDTTQFMQTESPLFGSAEPQR